VTTKAGTPFSTRTGNYEAQDVVQETFAHVSKSMKSFKYDNQGSFKSWLLQQTRWRISDQFAKRQKGILVPLESKSGETSTLDRIADPEGLLLEKHWQDEWETNLLEVAITRVKNKVDPRDFQIFDLSTSQNWSPGRIAQAIKTNVANVYLVKHRVKKLIEKEVQMLMTKPI
jgi:RNA polymerase sigma-70 factor (ECF subfamily)